MALKLRLKTYSAKRFAERPKIKKAMVLKQYPSVETESETIPQIMETVTVNIFSKKLDC